jgi:hypothetical protein
VKEWIDLAKATAWPMAIIIGAAFIYGLVRRGMVSSLSATKDGLVLGLTPVDKRESSRHAMDKRIIAVDDALTLAAKRVTKAMRRPMIHAVADVTNCPITKRAMGSALLDPLFDACDENDFKTHLSAAERDQYVREKVSMVREYYDELSDATATGCAVDDGENDLPPWEEAEPRVKQVVETWAERIAYAVNEACAQKIGIYSECRPLFVDAKDKYFVGVVDECITKNRGYIEALNVVTS